MDGKSKMRLWSIHPQYLDAKGLVALWREALLAQNVLLGKTKGYLNHPQLKRFRISKQPVALISLYLRAVYEEAQRREYDFQREKISSWPRKRHGIIPVEEGQIRYELEHLKKKLKARDFQRYSKMGQDKRVELHPLFKMVKGGIADWERVL